MYEWLTVRRDERAIYTYSRIQPFRSASEVPTQIARTSGPSTKHCLWRSQRWSTQPEPELLVECLNFRQSGLLTFVGTPDAQPSQGAKSQGIGTSGESRDFQHLELPTLIGTSDEQRCTSGLAAKLASIETSDTKCQDF